MTRPRLSWPEAGFRPSAIRFTRTRRSRKSTPISCVRRFSALLGRHQHSSTVVVAGASSTMAGPSNAMPGRNQSRSKTLNARIRRSRAAQARRVPATIAAPPAPPETARARARPPTGAGGKFVSWSEGRRRGMQSSGGLADHAERAHRDAPVGLAPWWLVEGAPTRRSYSALIFDDPPSEATARFWVLRQQRLLYSLTFGQRGSKRLGESASRWHLARRRCHRDYRLVPAPVRRQ